MSKLTYQQHGNQDTRIPVNQRRTDGGRVLEDNRASFAAKQLKQDQIAQRSKEEDERLKGKSGAAQLAKKGEETAQAKLSGQSLPIQRAQQPAKPNNTGLPDNLKNGIESLSGLSMDKVKVHYNSAKPAQLNALAYAQGTDIHVGPGQEQHLPHEAWHVVQQAQGRVKPTMQMKGGVPVNDDKGLEQEADMMGNAALAGGLTKMHKVDTTGQIASLNSSPFQLRPDVYSTAHFANPAAYLSTVYPGNELNEDAGSGGILDEPVRVLVLALASDTRRETYASRLDELGGGGIALAASLRQNVFDRESANTWVTENTLRITNIAPSFLTIENVMVDDDPTGPAHTFHRDHGKVVLTDQGLIDAGINSKPERGARRALANGPFNTGWIRGHYGVLNMRHRFIEHIHVDKDGPEDQRFEIYNTDSPAAGVTAAGFNIANRAGLTEANDGRAEAAATAAEGEAKRVAWETYAATLPDEDN